MSLLILLCPFATWPAFLTSDYYEDSVPPPRRQSTADFPAAGRRGAQKAGPGVLQAAQNVYFTLAYEPVQMNTPATQQFENYLKGAGVTGVPTEAEYNSYLSVVPLVQGLEGAGAHPTQASLISSLSNIHNWNATGLFGTHTMDINNRVNIIGGVDNCEWMTKLSGTTFELVPGADPICGTQVPGESVSASS